MQPERVLHLLGLAHVEHVNVWQVLGDPLGLDFEQAGVGLAHRPPVGRARHLAIGRLAGAQIGRHRDIDLLGMRQVQVLHEPDEVAFIGAAANARVVSSLFCHRRHRAATVVMRRKEQARIRAG